MSEFFIEIYGEEIPSRYQKYLCEELLRIIKKLFHEVDIIPLDFYHFVGPRRVGVFCSPIGKFKKGKNLIVKGPKIDAHAKAIDGFLRKYNLKSVDHLDIVKDKKGAYYQANINVPDLPINQYLKQEIPNALANVKWQKSMCWGNDIGPWIRPIRSILCLCNDEIVDFTFANVKTSDFTFGHFFDNKKKIFVKNFSQYKQLLLDNNVVINSNERKEIIKQEVQKICDERVATFNNNEKLFDEIAGLIEKPIILAGDFDKKFLDLPSELLISVMQDHQKYITMFDKNNQLLNSFIFVANNHNLQAVENMKKGYEQVIISRFSDAGHYVKIDQQTPVEKYKSRLNEVSFFEKLGSMSDKVKRLEIICVNFCSFFDCQENDALMVARYSKLDLTSLVVTEFPSLQGIMGSYYCHSWLASDGNDDGNGNDDGYKGDVNIVSQAIKDHYKPISANDIIPPTKLGQLISFCDKLDNLCQFWFSGNKPTSSKDPFALRRSTLGIIKILTSSVPLALPNAIEIYLNCLSDNKHYNYLQNKEIAKQSLLGFIKERAKHLFLEQNISVDVIEAVLEYNFNKLDMPIIFARMQEITVHQNAKKQLSSMAKRIQSVLDISLIDKKFSLDDGSDNEYENQLMQVVNKARKDLSRLDNKDLQLHERISLSIILALETPIEVFFKNVMVNSENINEKKRRQNILAVTFDLFTDYADCSKLI